MIVFATIKQLSERLPGKNRREILPGVELWRYALQAFRCCDVFVDTDDPDLAAEIYRISRGFVGLTAYLRSAEHVAAANPANAMFARFLAEQEIPDDQPVAYTHVTTPFVRASTLAMMAGVCEAEGRPVAGVRRVQNHCVEPHPADARRIVGTNFGFGDQEPQRTQDLDPVYEAAHVYVLTPAQFRASGSVTFHRTVRVYELDPVECIDIDTAADFRLAQTVALGLAQREAWNG